jgi:hypothetical protein
MRVNGAGRRTHEVRVDWEKTVLDADVLCPDCGALTHHHGVFPDLVLQCSICGGWYSADAGLYLGDEVRVIVRGYRLRKHARVAWMLEEAIRDREAESGKEDYRDQIRERSAIEFAGEGELCAHLLPKGDCRICSLEEEVRWVRGEVARLESERPCVTCRTKLAFPQACRDWSAEYETEREQRRRAEVAEARAEAAEARVAALAAEVKGLLAAGADGDRVMKPFEPGGESGD